MVEWWGTDALFMQIQASANHRAEGMVCLREWFVQLVMQQYCQHVRVHCGMGQQYIQATIGRVQWRTMMPYELEFSMCMGREAWVLGVEFKDTYLGTMLTRDAVGVAMAIQKVLGGDHAPRPFLQPARALDAGEHRFRVEQHELRMQRECGGKGKGGWSGKGGHGGKKGGKGGVGGGTPPLPPQPQQPIEKWREPSADGDSRTD
jgi:hypothetical protein